MAKEQYNYNYFLVGFTNTTGKTITLVDYELQFAQFTDPAIRGEGWTTMLVPGNLDDCNNISASLTYSLEHTNLKIGVMVSCMPGEGSGACPSGNNIGACFWTPDSTPTGYKLSSTWSVGSQPPTARKPLDNTIYPMNVMITVEPNP